MSVSVVTIVKAATSLTQNKSVQKVIGEIVGVIAGIIILVIGCFFISIF
jgi:hypothetical protein